MDTRDGIDGATKGLGPGVEPVTPVFDRRTHPDRARAWQAAPFISMKAAFAAKDLDGLAGSVDVLPLGPFLLADLSLSAGTISETPFQDPTN